MNEEIRSRILQKIREYGTVILTRHIRPDGDAIGSSRGLEELIRSAWPQKKVYVANEDGSDKMQFIDPPEQPLRREDYSGALVIVLDTANVGRISNRFWNCGAETVKIDHHIELQPFGDLSWVEEHRSSTCEMIAALSFGSGGALPMTAQAAKCLYTGLVTDTGRFRFGPTTGETLRIAASLVEYGIDTDRIHAELNMESYSYLQFKADMLNRVQLTAHGVAYIYVTAEMQRRYGLNREEASSVVNFLDSIRGSLIWLAFIDNMQEDANYAGPSVRVRLRSRFLPIVGLAEKYRGGGHENASGATVYTEKEIQRLIDDADSLLAEYKRTHTDWL